MTSKIYPIYITRTIEITPKEYLEFCAENKDEPTQEGFYEYIQDWIDEGFRYGEYCGESITIQNNG